METRTINILFIVGVALLATSCVKDKLYDSIPPTNEGALIVTTDWAKRSPEATIPENYVIRIGETEQTVTEKTNTFNEQFEPGKYMLMAYNTPENMTIDNNTASVKVLSDGTLNPMPGYLFGAAEKINVTANKTQEVTLKMQQYTRELILTLKLNENDAARITQTDALLTGITSAIDLTTGVSASQNGKNVKPEFKLAAVPQNKTRISTTGQNFSAALRLLGVEKEEENILTLTFTLTDGSTQTIVTNLTKALESFDTDIKSLQLEATLSLPTEGNFTSSVSGWIPGNGTSGENGNAEQE